MMADHIRPIVFEMTCDLAWSWGVCLCITVLMTGLQLVKGSGIGS